MKYLYKLIINLKNENVRISDSYEWLKLLKVSFINKKEIMVQSMFQRNRKKSAEEDKFIANRTAQNKDNYGYEYIGNKERLVVTPVTGRCFLNIMTTIFYYRGGSLQRSTGSDKNRSNKRFSQCNGKGLLCI